MAVAPSGGYQSLLYLSLDYGTALARQWMELNDVAYRTLVESRKH